MKIPLYALVVAEVVVAYPGLLNSCGRVIEVDGPSVMGAAPLADASREWIIERDGVQVACGGKYVSGETLTVRLDSVSGGLQYVMELVAGGSFPPDASGCDGDTCGGSRCGKGTASSFPDGGGQEVIAPTDGTDFVVHGAWASSFGAVNVPADCSLVAAAPTTTTPAPTTSTMLQEFSTAKPSFDPTTATAAAAATTRAPTSARLVEAQQQNSCPSTDPEFFDFSLRLDSSLTFSWRIDGDLLLGQLLKEGGGYASIAASRDGSMGGSPNGIVGLGDALAEKYDIYGDSTPIRSDLQTLRETSTTVSTTGVVDYRFTKILAEDGEIEIVPSGFNTFIWAYGDSGFNFHGKNRGALDLDLSTCVTAAVSTKPVRKRAVESHGMLMVAAWAYLGPLGVLFARAKKLAMRCGYLKAWLYCHVAVQVAALVFTAIGFATIYKAVKDSDARDGHLKFRHAKLGVGVMAGAAAQLLLGILRPHPPQSGNKSWARLVFELLHRFIGYGTLLLALFAMFSGVRIALELQYIHEVQTWNIARIAPIATTGLLGLLLTAYIFIAGTSDSSSSSSESFTGKNNGYQRQNGAEDTSGHVQMC